MRISLIMQKLFSSAQVRKADAYTIQNEPISSIGLMERAAGACVEWMNTFQDLSNKSVLIFCGPGNNGGDGLAIARMLMRNKFGFQFLFRMKRQSFRKIFLLTLTVPKLAGLKCTCLLPLAWIVLLKIQY